MSADSPAEYVRGLEENNRKLRVALVEAQSKVQELEADNRALRRQLIEAQSKVRELELQLASENAAKLRAEEQLGHTLTNLNEAWQS